MRWLRDEIIVSEYVVIDYDDFGNPVWQRQVLGVLPASVSYRTTALVGSPLGPDGAVLTQEMNVTTPPFDFEITLDGEIEWRGDRYRLDGTVTTHRHKAGDHHVSFPIKRIA